MTNQSITFAGDVGRSRVANEDLVAAFEAGRGVDVLLSDGSTAHIRPISPADGEEIHAFHGRLSSEAVWLRYFTAHPELSDGEVARLTDNRDPDHLALVVQRDGRIIGVAQYEREVGRDDAEVAFVIEDRFQGRGIGPILLEHLAVMGRHHGIKRFVADTLTVNTRMVRVFADAGYVRHSSMRDGVIRVILDIAPTEEARSAAEHRDEVAIRASIARLLQPRSVAVVGAAREAGKIGHELLVNLVRAGFTGPVYPVNPNAASVSSIPCWPNLAAIPGTVDMAVIAVPAALVPDAVRECGEKGVGGLVIVSSGFAESGKDGSKSQAAIVRLAHSYGMRLVGPNCFGVLNTDLDYSLNATFAPDLPYPGEIGFVSQSGGLGIAILAEARARATGLSGFVSMGNKADVSGNDLLVWWDEDERTSVILMYLESFGNPRRFSHLARRISRSKPIVVVKSGRSAAGQRAASSHTAALASPDRMVDALFDQTGVIRVDTIEELFDVSEVLSNQPMMEGPRIGILTNSGGPGVLCADASEGHGLSVVTLSGELQARIRQVDPSAAGASNPIDLGAGASAEAYRQCLEILLESGEVDAVVVVFTPPLVTRTDDVQRAILAAIDHASSHGVRRPVVASLLGTGEGRALLTSGPRKVPCFTYPETAVRALARISRHVEWRRTPRGELPPREGLDPNTALRIAMEGADASGWVLGEHALAVLSSYGLPVLRSRAVATGQDVSSGAAETVRVARDIGYPVALKAVGAGIVHKSDIGGVALDLFGDEEVRKAYTAMAGRIGPAMTEVLVEEMSKPGVETIVGVVQDPSFGPHVLFGLGGVAVELLGDSTLRMAPLTDEDARRMVTSLRGSALLTGGYRGGEAVDTGALCDILLRVSRLAEDLPEIAELDMNPVIARPDGALVVDARLRVALPPGNNP